MFIKIDTFRFLKYFFIISITWTFFSCGSFRISNKELDEILENEPAIESQIITVGKRQKIRLIKTIKHPDSLSIVFIHGAPGGTTDFMAYHKDTRLNQNYNIISYDRPGYGKSNSGRRTSKLSYQANALNTLLDSLKLSNVVLVAHSFGGPIALQFTHDFPEKTHGLVLAAVAIDPDNERFFWFSKFGRGWFRWLLPKSLKSTGREKYTHVKELKKLSEKLSNINSKICVIHGTQDEVVPFVNLEFAGKKLINSDLDLVGIKGGNHFITYNQYHLVVQKMLKTLE